MVVHTDQYSSMSLLRFHSKPGAKLAPQKKPPRFAVKKMSGGHFQGGASLRSRPNSATQVKIERSSFGDIVLEIIRNTLAQGAGPTVKKMSGGHF